MPRMRDSQTPSEDSLKSVRKSDEKLFTKDNLGMGLPFQFQYDDPKVPDGIPLNTELRIAL